MDKQGKKSLIWAGIAIAAALLSFVAVSYAWESNANHVSGNNMLDMMGGKSMDVMHSQMTKNLEPELKKQMEGMHEQCEKLHDEAFEGEMMR